MKSSVFAALVGLATAGGSTGLRTDQLGSTGYSTTTTTSYSSGGSSLGGSSLSTSLPVYSVGSSSGQGAKLTGVSDLAVTSLGGLSSGGIGLSSGTGLSNIGTGAVLVTSTSTGASNIASGRVITDGNFPKADLAALSGASSSLVNNNVVAGGIINNAVANNAATLVRSVDSLFVKLPSSAQIDALILSADSVAILKTIQTVATENSLPCDQRIAYLLELLGRLRAAIEKKVFASDQLKIVIDGAVAEITRLTALINTNRTTIAGLKIDDLKNRLAGFITQLEGVYVEYNKVEAQIPVLEAQVTGNDREIDILIRNSDAERNRIANDKLKLTEVLAEIANLQARLRQLQDNQAALQASINRGETNIANNEKAIADLRVKIADLEDQIRALTDQADTLSSQAKDLEVKVGRLRTDISVNDTKKTRLLKDISALEDRIALERKKNIPDDLGKLNDMVATLRRIVPTVESEIDRHYYYCFGEGKVQIENTGGVVVYIVRGEAFGNYLRNLYGRNIVVPAVNGNVLFNRVDIFGAPWSGAFGYPFGSGAFGGNDLSLTGSFSCLNPGALVTGSGTISAIGGNWIEALDGNGGRNRFNLGSCSRL